MIPLLVQLVESVLSKIMEELEHRLATQNEKVGFLFMFCSPFFSNMIISLRARKINFLILCSFNLFYVV